MERPQNPSRGKRSVSWTPPVGVVTVGVSKKKAERNEPYNTLHVIAIVNISELWNFTVVTQEENNSTIESDNCDSEVAVL